MHEVHLPTVTGEKNVVSIPAQAGVVAKRYKAFLVQVGGGAPAPTVIEDSINPVGGLAIGWTRVGQGVYRGTKVGAFAGVPYLSATMGDVTGTAVTLSLQKIDDDIVELTSVDPAGAVQDDMESYVGIDVPTALVTNENIFDYLLTQLDSIQLTIWTKIVLRFVDNIGIEQTQEVDGASYRRTGVFATSVVNIRS